MRNFFCFFLKEIPVYSKKMCKFAINYNKNYH